MGVSIPVGFVITGIITFFLLKRKTNKSNATNHLPLNLISSDSAYNSDPRTGNLSRQTVEYLSPIFSEETSSRETNSHLLQQNELVPAVDIVPTRIEHGPLHRNISVDLRAQIVNFSRTSKREIRSNMFTVGDQIGKGNFGKVFQGHIIGLHHPSSKTTVAIKAISGQISENELDFMLREIKIMNHISPNLNLVSMVASCTSDFEEHGNLWLLLEFCQYGDLRKFLKFYSSEILTGSDIDTINHRCLIMWAFDVANGMKHLEEKKIMHGDLAARNVLVNENPIKGGYPIAKVADFGLSKELNDSLIYRKESRMEVPWRWMALEYLVDRYFTLKSDVWSFGVLFWEILSLGNIPYGHQRYEELIIKLKSDYRLSCPDGLESIVSWSPEIVFGKVSKLCFVANPDERGTFSDVVKLIAEELKEDELNFYNQIKENYKHNCAEHYLNLNSKRYLNVIP